MQLCDYFTPPPRRDDPPKRCPDGPLRDTAHADQLRCLRCGWWAPNGNLPSHERVRLLAAEAASILAKLADDYRTAHSVAFAPIRRGGNGRSSGHGDPTGNVVVQERRLVVRDYAALTARLLERVVRDLRAADEAVGEAVYRSDPGPTDRPDGHWYDQPITADTPPDRIPETRPDLRDAHAALLRRRQRDEE